jgi:hypothetical protein
MAEEVQSGYVPGRALSPDAYGNSFVDFYKDYIGSTGIKSTVPIDEEEEDKDKYVAPNIMDVGGGGDSPEFNLLSSTFQPNKSGGGTTFYDNKVSSVDIQSMDLSSKSWDDYKKGQGRTDKSEFKRNSTITGVGVGIFGLPGAMVGGALLGKKEPTPWGSENLGAGMFNAIGNMAASAKYDAFKEIEAFGAAKEGILDFGATPSNMGDGGYAINVDGTVLVRGPGNSNYIGTLPNGMSNQQVLSLEAIQKGFLPPREGTYINGGIGNEEGFGVSGLGGYTSTGAFVDANGQVAAYGSMAALESLAKTDFGGSREKAEQWLSEVRKDRSIFDFSPHMSAKEAQEIKNRINGETSSSDTNSITPTSTFTNIDSGNFVGNQDVSKNYENYVSNTFDPKGMDFGQYKPGGGYAGEGQVKSSDTFTKYDIDTRLSYGQTLQNRIDATKKDMAKQRDYKQDIRDDEPTDDSTSAKTEDYEFTDIDGTTYTEFSNMDNFSYPQGRNFSAVNDFTGPGSISGIDGVEQAAVQQAADSAGAGSESDKIVCTAMNNAYGFGSFRQTIWLKHSRNLDPAYQLGYHKLFRPLIKYAYTEDSLPNRIVKKWLEGVAKRRTADIWLQHRGKKRYLGGRIERAILEPICYIVGKL